MKKIISLFIVLLLSLALAACGDDDEVTEEPQDDPAPSEDAETDQNEAEMDENTEDDSTAGDATEDANQTGDDGDSNLNTNYIFTSFDLEADIEPDDDAVDVDYEEDQDDNETEASYRHTGQDIDLQGNEAMDTLDGIFTGFNFDENTPSEDVLSEVMEAFNIPEDAAKVELDIDFANGTEIEYEQ
jgi:hypothetical protein